MDDHGPVIGGSAGLRMNFEREDWLGGPQPPSWSKHQSFVMGFWGADGEQLGQKRIFSAVVGDGGQIRRCSSQRERLISAMAHRLLSRSHEYLDVVVKVEWHAWRCSWAFCLRGVAKSAPAADDTAAKSGADVSDEETGCVLGAAEGPAADDTGAAYKVAYQYHEDFLEDPIHRFNGEGAAYFLMMRDPDDLPEDK